MIHNHKNKKGLQSALLKSGETNTNTCVISRYKQLLILNVDIVKIVDTKYRKLWNNLL